MIFDFSCDIGHIQLDVPHQIWERSTIDSQANIWYTRFLNNKPVVYLNNILHCYFSYLSPDFINQTFTIFGLILFGIGLYYIVVNKKWPILTFLLLAPISPLFDLPQSGLAQTIILYSALILVMFFGVKKILKIKK